MSVVISKRRHRIKIHHRDGFQVLDLGHIEIWDGADLSLLRDMMTETIEKGARKVGVDMTYVKYIPSGFFGMMCDWLDRGIPVRLYTPQPNVANMMWFRQFFVPIGNDVYDMVGEPLEEIVPPPEQIQDAALNAIDEDIDLEAMSTWTTDMVSVLADACLATNTR